MLGAHRAIFLSETTMQDEDLEELKPKQICYKCVGEAFLSDEIKRDGRLPRVPIAESFANPRNQRHRGRQLATRDHGLNLQFRTGVHAARRPRMLAIRHWR